MGHGPGPRRRGTIAGLVLALLVALAGCGATGTAAPPAGSPVVTGTSSSSSPAGSATSPSPAPSGSVLVSPPAADGDQTPPSPSSTAAEQPSSDAPAATTGPAAPPAPLTLPESPPVSLSVPAIGVSSPLSSLGRNPDGTVEVPSLDDPNAGAGWFRDSPEPGSLGPAIILGHVDSREYGPGVFFDLKNLSTGDSIEITRADGTVAVFTVDSVQDVPKAQFPTQQVYGNLDHAGLRLITCGGVFDSEVRSYEDNIIAFASLTSARSA